MPRPGRRHRRCRRGVKSPQAVERWAFAQRAVSESLGTARCAPITCRAAATTGPRTTGSCAICCTAAVFRPDCRPLSARKSSSTLRLLLRLLDRSFIVGGWRWPAKTTTRETDPASSKRQRSWSLHFSLHVRSARWRGYCPETWGRRSSPYCWRWPTSSAGRSGDDWQHFNQLDRPLPGARRMQPRRVLERRRLDVRRVQCPPRAFLHGPPGRRPALRDACHGRNDG